METDQELGHRKKIKATEVIQVTQDHMIDMITRTVQRIRCIETTQGTVEIQR